MQDGGMSDRKDTSNEMQLLRELLLKPIYEQNRMRDQKIMEFVEQFSTDLTSRVSALEQRLGELASLIDSRDSVVSDIGEGIASLGQQLRQLVSRAEAHGAQMPAERPAKSARK